MFEVLMGSIESILIGVLALITASAIALLGARANTIMKEIGRSSKSEFVKNTLSRIGDIMESVANHTTKTFVEGLKKDGKFDAKAAVVSMNKSKNLAIQMFDEEATSLILEKYGNIDTFLETGFESILEKQQQRMKLAEKSES